MTELNQEARFATAQAANQFVFGGESTFTLRSAKTGARFTYKVEASDDGLRHFVKVLTGPDNRKDYSYFGFFDGPEFVHAKKKTRITPDAPSAKAFSWFAQQLRKGQLHEALEVYHEGRCAACNRALTTPESVRTGFGPDCSERLGITRIVCSDPELDHVVAAPKGKTRKASPKAEKLIAEGAVNAAEKTKRVEAIIAQAKAYKRARDGE